jgi:NAD(P)-dependent dehydrogenase (short-subunit alcohol dehydrogenase family)
MDLLVEKAGGKCLFVKANVAIEEEIADLVGRTVEEFGRLDFAFNNACAAIIETDVTARIRGDEKLRGQFLTLHPMGRFGQVEEVAAAVLYLCSPKAGFTTGVALPLTAAHPHKPQKTARHVDRRDQTCTTSGGNPRGAAESGGSRQSKATPLGLAADYSARSGDALVWNSHRGTSVHDRFDG